MPEWFATRFASKFNQPVPDTLASYLADHPAGLWSEAGSLWKAQDIIDGTEERDLQEKGVFFIGTTAFESIFLLRARDGKVFVVDRLDHSIVDATFCDIDTCTSLIGFEEAPPSAG